MGKFSIMDILNDNSKINKNSDDKFETKMINIFDIVESEFNFFSTAEIDDLADSIEMFGVMQNLIVKELGNGKYKLIAGHRRRRGCIKLVNEGKEQFKFVPCKIESSEDDIREKLLLIYTNSTTRELSDYEKVEQAKQLKELLMEYKKDHNLPGRVRDLVADTLKISATQVARMDSISHNLTDNFKNEFKENKINISTAYEMSGLEKEKQEEIFRAAKERENISDTFNISLKEIRELKQPIKEEVDVTLKQELELSDHDKWLIRCEVLKEMCNSICKMMSYVLEKNNYNMETIMSLSRDKQESSFGFGDDGAGHSRYMAACKSERYYVEEFKGIGKWTFEAGEIDKQIWNFNGREWHLKHPKLTIDNLDLSVSAYNGLHKNGIYTIDKLLECTRQDLIDYRIGDFYIKQIINRLSENGLSLKQNVTETFDIEPGYIENVSEAAETVIKESESVISERECGNCIYDDMDSDKYRTDHPETKEFPCNNCDDKLNHWVPKIVKPDQADILPCDTCAREVQGCCNYPNTKDDYCVEGDKWQPKESDPVETVEADIIRAEGLKLDYYSDEEGWHEEIIQYDDAADEPGNLGELFLAKEILRKKQDTLNDWIEATKNNLTSDDTRNINKLKIEVGALAAYICDIDNIVNPIPEPVQPELPILKNNDQRKDFIDNYISWPVWIDQSLTGEKYYRYDLSSNVAIVVKVSRKHAWERYKETKDFEYGAEQYYLLGIKTTYSTSQKGIFTLDSSRTFYECCTNKSTLIDYLKEFQKRN